MEEPVTIVDRDVLKVLSADTRMDIMKILADGGRMPSFIGKKLNKSDATIIEHMKALEKAGLVKRVEQPGKKFVFYTLTEKGVGIVSSKSKRLVIILSSSVLSLSAGLLLGYQYLTSSVVPKTQLLGDVARSAETASQSAGAATTVSQTEPNITFAVSAIFLTLSFIGFLIYFMQKRKLGGSR